MKNRLLLFYIISSTILICQVQLPLRGTLRTAKMLERKGDLNNAIAIYKGILEKNPDHYQAVISLKNLYKNNQLYDQGISFLINQIQRDSMNISYNLDLVELYFLNDEIEKSNTASSSGLKRYKKNRSYYRLLNNIFIKYDLKENIDILLKNGRAQFGNSFLAFDIGVYYQSKSNYISAMNEFSLDLLNNKNNYNRIGKRILMMSDKKGSHTIIESELLKILPKNPNLISNILCDFYFKLQRFENSYNIKKTYTTENINELNSWIKFASNLNKERQFKYASKAYNYVIRKNLNTKITETALLGLAKTLESQILPEMDESLIEYSFNHNIFFKDPFQSKNYLSLDYLASSLTLYDSLIISIKDQNILSEVCYRLGEVQFKILHNFDTALLYFEKAMKANPNKLLKQMIILRIVDIYIAKGNPERGKVFLLLNKRDLTRNQIKEKSILCDMFTKSISEIILDIDSLISEIDLEDTFFNDLMELKVFLNKHNSQDDHNKIALKYFIKSEFYRKQKKVGDAINELVYLIKNYPESKIVSLAILRLSLFHHKEGEYKESLKYSSLLKNTEFEDQGIILSGQIFQYNLIEPDKALSNYMRIINEFPQSIFFEPIRVHVREMRKGKNI